jgi:hypothetical protein
MLFNAFKKDQKVVVQERDLGRLQVACKWDSGLKYFCSQYSLKK